MTKLEVVQGDITQQPDIDAIVNAANSRLEPGGGVCGAIYRAAGLEQLDACVQYLYDEDDGISVLTGQCVHTPAFALPNKYIIHAVGPVYPTPITDYDLSGQLGLKMRRETAQRQLASAYSQSLILADVLGCRSIAFPAISTGIYGYPPDDAALVASASVLTTMGRTPGIELVRFVCFDQDTEENLRGALAVSAIDVVPPPANTNEQLTLPFPD